MDSYDATNKNIDAVVDYTFNAGYKDVMRLKYLELFCYDDFEKEIQAFTDMKVYLDGTDIFDIILKENSIEKWNKV